MSGETCSIFGRCRNKVTGQLTDTPSQLHSDLLDLTKQAESVKRKRDTANKMFLITQSPTFDQKYFENLYPSVKDKSYQEMIQENPYIEPSLWDLYQTLKGLESPNSFIVGSTELQNLIGQMNLPSLQDVIKYFNSKLKEHTFTTYQQALDELLKNKQYSPNSLYMLTIAMNEKGQFVLQATENTQEEQQKLLDNISAYQNATLLIKELQDRGLDINIVNAIQDALLRMPMQDTQGVIDNVDALLQVSPEMFNPQLAYKTALLIVQALENGDSGKPHPYIKRLKNLVQTEYQLYRQTGKLTWFVRQLKESNPELWQALEMGAGADETALAAYALAGYFENWESTKKYIEESNAMSRLIDRVVDWFRALFGNWAKRFGETDTKWYQKINPMESINFASTKMKARVLSLQIVKSFLKDTNKLDIYRAEFGRLNMQEDTKVLFNALTNGLQELDFVLKELKDLNYKAWKVFNNQFKDRLTNLHAIASNIEQAMEKGTSSFDDIQSQMEMMQELVALVQFVGENINSCKDSLDQVIRGVDRENKPLDYNESAKMVKYAERILNLADTLAKSRFKILATVDPSITFQAPNGFTYSMKDYIANLTRVFDQLADITSSIDFDFLGPNRVKGNMKTALSMARGKVAMDLLVEINGGEFIAIEQYISAKGAKIVKNAAKMYNIKEDLLKRVISGEDSVDCCPPSQWISRLIDSMADCPDIINQLVKDKVAQQKHSANIKTLDMMERLRALYRNVPTHHGIRNTRRYMEVDDDGKLTGNILSNRHYGKWEKEFYDAKKGFEEEYFQKHKDDYRTRDEMLGDKLYLVEFGKFVENWHQYHSKKVVPTHIKDGTPLTYDDGSNKTMYVPLLEEEREQREDLLRSKGMLELGKKVSTYDNPAFYELTDEDRAWLKEYLTIKQELDDLLPQGCTPMGGLRVPQFRGTLTNRIGNIMRQSGRNAMFSVVRYLKLQGQEMVGESPFETEFGGEHDTYDSDLYDSDGNIIFTRAHSNMIQTIPHLPLYGVRKLPDPDQLSTDLCSSLLAYASMAYNYEALDQVVSAVEVTRDLLHEDREGRNGLTIARQRSVTSQEAGMYGRLEDFINQQIYSIYGDSSKSRLNRFARKLFSKVARFGSLWYLGWNLHGGIVNGLTGMYQIIRRGMKGEGFSFGAMLKAHCIYFLGLERTKGRAEAVKNLLGSPGSDYSETHDALHMFKKRYNVNNSNERDFKDWHIGTFGYTFSFKQKYTDLMHLCYSFFEDYMSTVPYLATALDTKLVTIEKNPDGSPHKVETNLWKALNDSKVYNEETKQKRFDFDYDKYYIKDKNATDVYNGKPGENQSDAWLMEKNRFQTDTNTFWIDKQNDVVYRKFDQQQESGFRNRAQMSTNAMHGVYNTQDAGAMMRFAAAGAVASLRKYAIGLVDDRFARARYDFRTRSIKQGDYVTMFDTILLSALYQPIDVWKENSGINRLAAVGNFLQNIGALATLPLQLCFSSAYKKHFTRLGLSQSQIRNLNGVIADQVICYLMEVMMSFFAPPGMEPPPDDEEDLEAFFNNKEKYQAYREKIKSRNYTIFDRFKRAAKGNFHLLWYYPFGYNPDGGRDFYVDGENPQLSLFQEAMLSVFIWSEKMFPFSVSPVDNIPSKEALISRIQKGGVDHKGYHYDKDGNLKFSKFTNYGTTPFSFQAIAYYTTYRNLVELRAYNPFYLDQTVREFRSILSSSLPGVQATIDVVSLGVQLGTEALREEAPTYSRGINKGYYKWYKRLEKSAWNPERSMSAVFVSGYQAQENFTYFLEKDGDTFLQNFQFTIK